MNSKALSIMAEELSKMAAGRMATIIAGLKSGAKESFKHPIGTLRKTWGRDTRNQLRTLKSADELGDVAAREFKARMKDVPPEIDSLFGLGKLRELGEAELLRAKLHNRAVRDALLGHRVGAHAAPAAALGALSLGGYAVHAAKKPEPDYRTKVAKLRVKDIEDDLGFVLDRTEEKKVRENFKDQLSRSFTLRHPILTGIPTLGIAPAIAKKRALARSKRRLLRDSPYLRKKVHRHSVGLPIEDLESYAHKTDRIRAHQGERTAKSLGQSAIAALLLHRATGKQER